MRAFVVAVLAVLAGCGGGEAQALVLENDAGEDAVVDSSTETDPADSALVDSAIMEMTPPDSGPVKPSWDLGEAKRSSCIFGPGSTTTETVGPAVPHGSALPFDHVVVLMMENRSFDHYFSKLPEHAGVTDVDVATDDHSNPDPVDTLPVKRFHETRYCTVDTAHNWGPVHLQYDEGLMDGFVMTSNPGGARAMGYYDGTDLPYYYWLAKTFGIGDRHFCSLLGPTWPNRFFFYGATAWGRTHTPDTPPLDKTKIVNLLDTAGQSWKIYRAGTASFGVVFGPMYAGSSISKFDDDVKNDNLPSLSIIDPNFSGGSMGDQNDEHPPANIQKGQAYVKRVLDALWSNPKVWQKTVFIVTYDEHGGFYDHVAPPPACEPDGDVPPDYKYDRLGFRVPMLVISPWSRPGYVSHYVTDHTSITRFIENRFDLPAMTNRDANAWPMLDYFDFDKPSFSTPPTDAPSATPDPAGVEWCNKNMPGTGKP
ncbi:MAG: phospholipase C [Polyangiales bacterium]